jgi:hypothetical protein
MTELTRKEYLQERFDKANVYLVGYLIGLDSLFKDDDLPLDQFEQILIEIEQFPITIEFLKEKPILLADFKSSTDREPRFNWDRWFEYDNLSQEREE